MRQAWWGTAQAMRKTAMKIRLQQMLRETGIPCMTLRTGQADNWPVLYINEEEINGELM